MMMIRMVTVMIRTMAAMITIIVAPSAVPMLRNAAIEMCIVTRTGMETTMMMIRVMTMMIRMTNVMITINVAPFALPMLPNATIEM